MSEMVSQEKGAISPDKVPEELIRLYENARIEPDASFTEIYTEYQSDLNRVRRLNDLDESRSPSQGDTAEVLFGKVAEALIFDLLRNHAVSDRLLFRATSKYDDYLHGADVVVEPRNAHIQGLATIDVTINQEDIKGKSRWDDETRSARPIGLEKKLERSKRYTEFLARFDPSRARELSGWIKSGGLHQSRTRDNERLFEDAEKIFLMKYYKAPEGAPEPGRPGFVIGGPQTVISVDTVFINRALQGGEREKRMLGDMALLEFMYCIEAEQQFLDQIIKSGKQRNIFFDQHFSTIKAWSHIFKRPDMSRLSEQMAREHYSNPAFRAQLAYYAQTFQKVFGN